LRPEPLVLPAPGPRKEALIGLVPPCALAAEIGADHGIISAFLLSQGICGRMVVSDISAASLQKARRLFAPRGLETRADFRVADGLLALDAPVEAIIIAGMGEKTIKEILRKGMDRLHGAALVLQSNTGVPGLRRWLAANGFRIDAERVVKEGRRYYIAMRAVEGRAVYSEKELCLGPCLLGERPPLLREYLAWRRGCLLRARGGDQPAVKWLEEEMDK